MDKQIQKQLLEQLVQSNFGRALEAYIKDEIEKLDSVSNIPNDQDFEVNARANKKAVKVLEDLLFQMSTPEIAKKVKPSYD